MCVWLYLLMVAQEPSNTRENYLELIEACMLALHGMDRCNRYTQTDYTYCMQRAEGYNDGLKLFRVPKPSPMQFESQIKINLII